MIICMWVEKVVFNLLISLLWFNFLNFYVFQSFLNFLAPPKAIEKDVSIVIKSQIKSKIFH